MWKKQNKVKYQFMGGGQDRKCVNSAKITRIKKTYLNGLSSNEIVGSR